MIIFIKLIKTSTSVFSFDYEINMISEIMNEQNKEYMINNPIFDRGNSRTNDLNEKTEGEKIKIGNSSCTKTINDFNGKRITLNEKILDIVKELKKSVKNYEIQNYIKFYYSCYSFILFFIFK